MKGQKNRKRPAPTKAWHLGTRLSVVNIRNPDTSSTTSSPSNSFQEGMLEFDSPLGQCLSRFLTVSQRSRGRGENRKKVWDRQEE